MCRHIYKTINDVRVCQRCGLTINLIDGRIIFDRKMPSTGRKKGKGQK